MQAPEVKASASSTQFLWKKSRFSASLRRSRRRNTLSEELSITSSRTCMKVGRVTVMLYIGFCEKDASEERPPALSPSHLPATR